MLWEKPVEKAASAMGYSVHERYLSTPMSPISRYSHMWAGGECREGRCTPRKTPSRILGEPPNAGGAPPGRPSFTQVEPGDNDVHGEADGGHDDPQDEEKVPILPDAEQLPLHPLQAPCEGGNRVLNPPKKPRPQNPPLWVGVSPRTLLRAVGQGLQLCSDTSTLSTSSSSFSPRSPPGTGRSILGTFLGTIPSFF